ncbi:sensor histidine kinase [Fredinandcohnia humi]
MVISIRKWFWIDYVIMGLRTYWFILLFAGMTGPFAGREFKEQAGFITIWLLLALLIPLFFWQPGKMSPHLFILFEYLLTGGLCIYYMFSLQQTTSMLTIPALIVGFVSDRRMWYWSAPTFIFIFLYMKLLVPLPWGDVITQTIYLLTLYGIGFLIHFLIGTIDRVNRLVEEVGQKNKALTQYAEQVEQLALLEERHRLARELHDSIGHRFTSIITSLDVAVELINVDTNGTKSRLINLASYTRNGLDEIRRSLHHIAPDDENSPLSIRIQSLIMNYVEHTGTSIPFIVEGDEVYMSRNINLTMVRCLQELMTNASRHGAATHIDITLTYQIDKIILKVKDNGKGFDGKKRGFGLTAMNERFEMLNGRLVIDSSPFNGTRVIGTIPIGGQICKQLKC